MPSRRAQGSETYNRLRSWDKDSAAAERLAAQILISEGFKAIDPMHPLGGRDGLKDVVCERDGVKWIGAVNFSRDPLEFTALQKKFKKDAKGVAQNSAGGFAFFTNQKLTDAERKKLTVGPGILTEIYHLERLTTLLNSAGHFGTRLEFLDIEMSREEQLSFISQRDAVTKKVLEEMSARMDSVLNATTVDASGKVHVPLDDLREFKSLLDKMTGASSGTFFTISGASIFGQGTIHSLRVPLDELKEFARLLAEISGTSFGGMSISGMTALTVGAHGRGTVRSLHVPLAELKEFESILQRLTGRAFGVVPGFGSGATVGQLQVPVNELKEYEMVLARVIAQLREKKALEGQ